MKSQVGEHNPSLEAIQAHIRTLAALQAELAQTTVSLSPEERQRITKFRVGGEEVVRQVTALAEEFEVALPGIPAPSLKSDLELVDRLRPLLSAAESLSRTLSDTILQAQSECWWGTTAYYTTMVRMSGGNVALAARLKPVVSFFALGKRRATKKAKRPATATELSASPRS